MVAIKQLGSNGGGWYGPNSSVPLENPTPFSNLLEMIAILLIPITVILWSGILLSVKVCLLCLWQHAFHVNYFRCSGCLV